MNSMRYRFYIIALIAAVGGIAAGGGAPAFAQGIVPPVGGPIGSPLDDRVLNDTRRDLESRIEEPLDEEALSTPDEPGIEDALEEVTSTADPITEPVLDGAPDRVLDTAGRTLDETATALPDAVQSVTNAAVTPLRPFVEGIDPYGRAIEKDVLIVLIEPAELAKIEQSGLPVTEQRRLPSLGLVLVRIEGPPSPSLAQAAVDIRSRFPRAAVDFNFLYRPAAEQSAEGGGGAQRGSPVGRAPTPEEPTRGAGVRLGLIDSAVSAEHAALAAVRVTGRDFVPYEDVSRPLGHGTAVASIMAANTAGELEILAASVFFQKPGYAPGASTESLLGALDWLTGLEVDVINMSLAGPADELLERALGRLDGSGPIVVAAVGNNGPTGDPLYPAAYESVLGVTAIDRDRRIFPYANRGDQVVFAAPGVNVKVANSDGGWRLESGTSMATPYVAAVIGGALHASETPVDALIESLKASALDLGEKGFDPVFGYGLISSLSDQNAAASLTE